MSRWLHFTRLRCVVVNHQRFYSRSFSTHSSVEHVRVPCASAGNIIVSLYNISRQDATTPLVIVLPPFSPKDASRATPLPSCFQDYPTAVINYRWHAQDHIEDERPDYPLHWPTPLHDVTFGYSWIMDNLGSGTDPAAEPRPAYVYGSYLGASLAAGLALTESHIPARSQPMTIRGLVAYNGIYNWTMFLPDHPIHRRKSKPDSGRKRRGLPLPFTNLNEDPIEEGGIFTELKHRAPGLFAEPSNLFDPFASACLFFHSANLHVPDDFTTPLSASAPTSLTPEFAAAIDNLAGHSLASPSLSQSTTTIEEGKGDTEETASELLSRAAHLAKQQKPPRKGYLVFPPRDSTLRLPPALLLYTQSSSRALLSGQDHHPRRSGRRRQKSENSFAVQAAELAGLMMRSLDMHELGGRGSGRRRPGKQAAPWEWEAEVVVDGDGGAMSGEEREWARWREIERRVQTSEIATSSSLLPSSSSSDFSSFSSVGGLGLDTEAEQVIAEWLREKVDEDFGEDGGSGL
ncbi:hypothetical protein C7999DRAFT_13521 [Corynascus novoguineensis]|uniref:Alpha/beta-hydrolase n=1 Tax=Corynascus novoguineensis TaxID=1126955 RepID=A0AAN7CWQ5_9PEZI|nr:hypothetical protein C7999DRAFT_13521 [Corynascus novoguineensis]